MLLEMYGYIFYDEDNDQAGVTDITQQTDERPDTSNNAQQTIDDAIKEINEAKDADDVSHKAADSANNEVDESDAANATYAENPANGMEDAVKEFGEAQKAIEDAVKAEADAQREAEEAAAAIKAAQDAIASQQAEDEAEQAMIKNHNEAEAARYAQELADEAAAKEALAAAEAQYTDDKQAYDDAVAAKEAAEAARVLAEQANAAAIAAKQLEWETTVKDALGDDVDVTLYKTVDDLNAELDRRFDTMAEDYINTNVGEDSQVTVSRTTTITVTNVDGTIKDIVIKMDDITGRDFTEDEINYIKTAYDADASDEANTEAINARIAEIHELVLAEAKTAMDNAQNALKDNIEKAHNEAMDEVERVTEIDDFADAVAKQFSDIFDDDELQAIKNDFKENFDLKADTDKEIDKFIGEGSVMDDLWDAKEAARINAAWEEYVNNFIDQVSLTYTIDGIDAKLTASDVDVTTIKEMLDAAIKDGTINLKDFGNFNDSTFDEDVFYAKLNALLSHAKNELTTKLEDKAQDILDEDALARETHNIKFNDIQDKVNPLLETGDREADIAAAKALFMGDDDIMDDAEAAVFAKWVALYNDWADARDSAKVAADAMTSTKYFSPDDLVRYNTELAAYEASLKDLEDYMAKYFSDYANYEDALAAHQLAKEKYEHDLAAYQKVKDAWDEWQSIRPENGDGIIAKTVTFDGTDISGGNPTDFRLEIAPGVVLTRGSGGNSSFTLTIDETASLGTIVLGARHGGNSQITTVNIYEAGQFNLTIHPNSNMSQFQLMSATFTDIPVFNGTEPTPPDMYDLEPPSLAPTAVPPTFVYPDFEFDFEEMEDGVYDFNMDDFPDDFINELKDYRFVYELGSDDYYSVTIKTDNGESVSGYINIDTGRFIIEGFNFDPGLVDLPEIPGLPDDPALPDVPIPVPTDPDIWDDVPERVFPVLSFDRELPTLKVPTAPEYIEPPVTEDPIIVPDPIIIPEPDDDPVDTPINRPVVINDPDVPLAAAPELEIEDEDVPLAAMEDFTPPPLPETIVDDEVPLAAMTPEEDFEIFEDKVPLGDFPPAEELETLVIADEIVPLGLVMPQTGVESLGMFITAGLMLSAATAAVIANMIRKYQKQIDE